MGKLASSSDEEGEIHDSDNDVPMPTTTTTHFRWHLPMHIPGTSLGPVDLDHEHCS
jgi:hypothetical protein